MSAKAIPSSMKQIMVKTLGTNFREVTEIVQVPVPEPGPKQTLVKTSHVAINAADILMTCGFYTPDAQLPFPAGIEAMGEIVAVGEGSSHKVGEFLAFIKFGSFSDYIIVDDAQACPLPSLDPVALCLTASAATASLALEKKGELKKGDKVLVTAAAGATGQFAVQLAKQAGCHVIGTCSTDEKASFLKSLGCDRPVIYTKESLDDVLKNEYPNGIDVVYESVGKEMLQTALKNIAPCGRIIIIGAISDYEGPGLPKPASISLTSMQLKSADIRCFGMLSYMQDHPAHLAKLTKMVASGELKTAVDNGENSENGPFKGIESIYDALDYMYAKKNKGKVVVAIDAAGTTL